MQATSIVIPFYNDDKNFETFFWQNYRLIKNINPENEIIAIDDTKNEKLFSALKHDYSDVILISHKKNRGFAVSVNEGVEAAKYEIVFLFNSDLLVSEDAFKFTVGHFNDEKLFAVTLQSHYPDGRIREGAKSLHWKGGMPKLRHAVRHFPKPDKNGIISSVYAVGGHCAVRKSMYLQLNGMDHKTFHPFYWEDSDLGIRALKKSWKIIYEPKAVVTHPMENSSIKTNFQKEYISEIKFRNRTFFALKNFNTPLRRAQIKLYLAFNFIKKVIKLKDVTNAYKQSLGLINEYKKIRDENNEN